MYSQAEVEAFLWEHDDDWRRMTNVSDRLQSFHPHLSATLEVVAEMRNNYFDDIVDLVRSQMKDEGWRTMYD